MNDDPAIRAARRAWADFCENGAPDAEPGSPGLTNDLMTVAAREMAKPIREVHYPRLGSVCAMYPEPLCNCGEEWKDCPTAKLIYTTEELAR